MSATEQFGEAERRKADEIAVHITASVRADLGGTGRFDLIDTSGAVVTDIDITPKFADWQALGAAALVTGRAVYRWDGRLRVEFRLWDVAAASQLMGQQYFLDGDRWAEAAHAAASALYERLVGEAREFQ